MCLLFHMALKSEMREIKIEHDVILNAHRTNQPRMDACK